MEKYNPQEIEPKWQKYWEENGTYKNYQKGKKFYALDMFPYISGEGLHVGHPKGYIATDIVSRFKVFQGYSVLHPMGWDAFGLPTENYAIKHKIHPRVVTEKNISVFKRQLQMFGFTYDWDREINTTDPKYYKWTQWIFLKMFEKGLAYESGEPINWCPSCKTGLALEDLEHGLCERCGTRVVQKKMRQWVLKMTDYADRLLYDLDSKDLEWEEMIKEQQRNWIGRSEGAEFELRIKNYEPSIRVYTTRLDTVYGMTYAVIAPEHPIIGKLKDRIANYGEVEKYIIQAQNKTELERTGLQKEKTGTELKGVKAINPFTREEIPIFVADYVIGYYGTGAVMAVPAHDERDWEFAKRNNLKIVQTVSPISEEHVSASNIYPAFSPKLLKGESIEQATFRWRKQQIEMLSKGERCFVDDGILVNSDKYSGLASQKAREEMAKWLEKQGIGKKTVNYKMRDWVFSRQRYWGEPIPIVHCKKCGAVGVPEKELPVTLPEVESYEPTGTGESPLANIKEWVNTVCPKCGGPAKRETNTMPQWAGSCWYYLRYIDPQNDKILVDKKEEKKWMPVDLYVGGIEHATRHLLYARFWHKFLYDLGAVSTKEPFKKLIHVGLISGEDGRKMSKRWGNVINPDDVIAQFGADSIRLYEMFMGPFTQGISWSTAGVSGARRFLEKVWKLQNKLTSDNLQLTTINSLLCKTIKKVTEDIENFRFNTAISQMMILVNEMEKQENLSLIHYSQFLILLSPFAPHIAEELWEKLGHKESIFKERWPKYDPKLIKDEEIDLVIQVNGRVRDTVKTNAGISEDEAEKLALQSEKVRKYMEGKKIKKTVFIKDKLINIVV